MNYYAVGANLVFALNLMLPEGDRKDRPYAVQSGGLFVMSSLRLEGYFLGVALLGDLRNLTCILY